MQPFPCSAGDVSFFFFFLTNYHFQGQLFSPFSSFILLQVLIRKHFLNTSVLDLRAAFFPPVLSFLSF